MTFKPIEEELEQYHFIVAVIYKGVTIITSQRLDLKSLKHSETCILNDNGYKHENEDELFIVFKGQLTLQLRSGDIVLNTGEMYVVPKGVEHCPRAEDDTHFMMIEPSSTAQTGELKSEVTVSSEKQEWI